MKLIDQAEAALQFLRRVPSMSEGELGALLPQSTRYYLGFPYGGNELYWAATLVTEDGRVFTPEMVPHHFGRRPKRGPDPTRWAAVLDAWEPCWTAAQKALNAHIARLDAKVDAADAAYGYGGPVFGGHRD